MPHTLFALSDQMQLAITGIVALFVQSLLSLLAMWFKDWLDQKRAMEAAKIILLRDAAVAKKVQEVATKAEVAASNVVAVKRDLEVAGQQTGAALKEIKETGDKIHELSNSAKGLILDRVEALSAKIVELSRGNPTESEAVEALGVARRDVADHAARQAIVDRMDDKCSKTG